MGVYRIKRKNGYSVFMTYSVDGKSYRRTVGFARFSDRAGLQRLEKEAKVALAKKRPAILEGTNTEPSKLTVAEFVERTYAKVLRRKGRRTVEREVYRLTKGPLGRFFGSRRLVDLKLDLVERFVDLRLTEAGPRRGQPRSGSPLAPLERGKQARADRWRKPCSSAWEAPGGPDLAPTARR